jgi:hypothetical protein
VVAVTPPRGRRCDTGDLISRVTGQLDGARRKRVKGQRHLAHDHADEDPAFEAMPLLTSVRQLGPCLPGTSIMAWRRDVLMVQAPLA